MNSSRRFLLILVCALAMPAQALSALPQAMLTQLKKNRIPVSAVSVYVRDLDADKTLLSWNAGVSRNPASVMKLVTTAAALDMLGPTFQWKTRFAAIAAPVHETVRGDLYIKGGGDPHLVSESFWADLRHLRHQGVRAIMGDLVLDTSYFQPLAEDPGAFDGEPLRSYNAPPHALLFNFRSVHFYFYSDTLRGKVTIVADPPPGNMKIRNQVKLVKGKCSSKMSRIRMAVKPHEGTTDVVFSGSFPRGCGGAELYRVVASPENNLFGAFQSYWKELGGSFTGQVKTGVVPAKAKVLYTGKSLPLADIIRKVNKNSNNVMARQLLLTLAAEQKGEPGTRAKGAQVIAEWLDRIGVGSTGFVVENGAGLSRKGRISAASLGGVLEYMYHSKNMPEYLSSLSINGRDGTMKKRLKHGQILAAARMKTGTIDHVKAIAGYLLTHQGRHLAVVVLINHDRSGAGRWAQDKLVQWLYDRY
ncbi:MAG: D-alanyl-D-alanine carboxypeptidase/D-alanyl-D-alanine-endopeptidase [Gammaproteobacteria bacterium]|nr:MAG: D-alanyl-D-alanine carboxypeptidase/D-alanyl-D-alanine-endopeptidase [Gammaproteobacteria bacterium]